MTPRTSKHTGMDAAVEAEHLLAAAREGDLLARSELLRRLDEEECPHAARALAHLDQEGREALAMRMAWGTPTTVRQVAVALAEAGDEASLPLLQEQLASPDEVERAEAAWALGHVRDVQAGEALAEALADEASGVRAAAARALAQSPSRGAIPALIAVLEDTDPKVVAHAAAALARLPDPRAFRPLLDLLERALQPENAGANLASTAEEARIGLSRILDRRPSALADEDLEAVAALPDLLVAREVDHPADGPQETPLDGAELAAKARAELARRAPPADVRRR